jgi:hypothetical protein
MGSVYLVWHVHEIPGRDADETLIGVYSSDAEARRAVERLRDKPGFKDSIDGFQIEAYEVGKDHWTEGFATVD